MPRQSDEGFPLARSLFTQLPPSDGDRPFGLGLSASSSSTRRQENLISQFPAAEPRNMYQQSFGPTRRSRRNSLFRQQPYYEEEAEQPVSPSGGMMSRSLTMAKNALSSVPIMSSLFRKTPPTQQQQQMEIPNSHRRQMSAINFVPTRRDSTDAEGEPRNFSLVSECSARVSPPRIQRAPSPPPKRFASPPPQPPPQQQQVKEKLPVRENAKGQARAPATSRRNITTVLKSIEKEYKDHLTLADFRTFQSKRRGILGNELKRLIRAQEMAVTSRCIDYEQTERAHAADEADARAFTGIDKIMAEGLPSKLDVGSESEDEAPPPVAVEKKRVLEEERRPSRTEMPVQALIEKKQRRIIEAPPRSQTVKPAPVEALPRPSITAPPPSAVEPPAAAAPVEQPESPVVTEPPTPPPQAAAAVTPPVPEPEEPALPPSLFELKPPAPEPTPIISIFGVPKESTPPVTEPVEAPPTPPALQMEQPKPAPSIFGTALTSESQPAALPFSLFGTPAAATTTEPPAKPLFGLAPSAEAKPAPAASIFGIAASKPTPAPAPTASSLFGGGSDESKPATSIFESTTPKPTTIFGAASSSAFPAAASSAPSIFDAVKPPTPAASSLFGMGVAPSSASLFGAAAEKPSHSIFGTADASPPISSSLFGTPAATSKPIETPSLFGGGGGATTSPTAVFGQQQSAASNTPLFGGVSGDRPSPAGSLFGSALSHVPSTASMFGGPKPAAPSLFGQTAAPSLFGQTAAPPPTSPFGQTSTLSPATALNAPVFGNASPSPVPAFGVPSTSGTSMFGVNTPQPFGQSPFANSQPQAAESQENVFTNASSQVRYRIKRRQR